MKKYLNKGVSAKMPGNIRLFLIAVLLGTSLMLGIGSAAWAQTVVYPEDGVAVLQNAVNAGGMVLLKATDRNGNPMALHAGLNEYLVISNPVILEGETGARIYGDTDSTSSLIKIFSPGVTLRNLIIDSYRPRPGAIYARALPSSSILIGDPIVIENNIITANPVAWRGAIFTEVTGGWPLMIRNNEVTVNNESWELNNGIWVLYPGLRMTGDVDNWDERSWEIVGAAPVDIVENYVCLKNGWDAISVWGWWVDQWFYDPINHVPTNGYWENYVYPPEWGDNGPVRIVGNRVISLGDVDALISLGRSNLGTAHCLVEHNTLEGPVGTGVWRFPWGGDTIIAGNDLTNVRAWTVPIMVNAHDTTVTENVFGPLVRC